MQPYPLSSQALVEDVLAQLDHVTETVRARFGGLSSQQLAWQPSRKAWGVGHCLVHLARTNELYREALTPAFRQARTDGLNANGPLKGRWFGRVFTGMVGPGGGVRVKTPKLFRPRQRVVEESSMETFLAEQHRFRGVVEEAAGLDLDTLRIVSPVSSWIKLTAGDALRVVVAHEGRHLDQAERVMAHGDFPR